MAEVVVKALDRHEHFFLRPCVLVRGPQNALYVIGVGNASWHFEDGLIKVFGGHLAALLRRLQLIAEKSKNLSRTHREMSLAPLL